MSWRLNHSTDIDLCDSFYARIAPQSLAKAGGRGNPDDWKYTNIPEPVMLERGYTGHSLYRSIGKHLDEFGLINMNGRMYDPVLRRFLGADPVVQKPAFSQSYNGYSYCFNNPLKYLDPTGFIATDGDTEESESIESAAMAYNALWGGSKFVQFWRERFGDMFGTVFGEEKYNAAVQRQKEKQERSSGGCNNPDVISDGDPHSKNVRNADGKVKSVSIGFAFIGGFGIELGRVSDNYGNKMWFFSYDGNIGYGFGVGINSKEIYAKPGCTFNVKENYPGYNAGIQWGVTIFGGERSGNINENVGFTTHWGNDYTQRAGSISWSPVNLGFWWFQSKTKVWQ